jgi:FtsP/CotA-like multicopper oxidase with cupredoxin domain
MRLAAPLFAAVLLGACGGGDGGDDGPSSSSPPAAIDGAATREPLAVPDVLASESGQLDVTLNVAKGTTSVAGVTVEALTYNGSFLPPLLRMEPGDHVRITLVNQLEEGTNLHTHGLHVSPVSPGDNVLITIPAGETYVYEYDLPDDHAPGTYWYHSHQHGSSEGQVFAGLSGIIEVGGLVELLPPELQGVRQQTFALKDVQIVDGALRTTDIDSNAPTTRLVNGQLQPVVSMRPGETQLWRLANIGADIFYRLSLGDVPFHVLAEDGNPASEVRPSEELVLPPGKRFDVLVQAPEAGPLTLSTLPYEQGDDVYPEVALASVDVEGEAETPGTLPSSFGTFDDLSDAEVDTTRTIEFSENEDNQFFIDGKMFDHDRVDTVVPLGSIEEWTIKNETDEQHPFHIHVDDFQVMSVNGDANDAVGWQDTVILPIRGEVVVRIHFRDFVGRFVYHCHILNHEDNGMMAVVEVAPSG